MKHLFSILLLSVLLSIVLVNKGEAQDTIIKTNGDVLIGSVLEVSILDVHYKLAHNPNGNDFAVFVIDKKNIKTIKYSPYSTDVIFTYIPNNKDTANTDNRLYKPEYFINPRKVTDTITVGQHQIVYHNKLIKEKQMYPLLMQTKDARIINLSEQSRKAKRTARFTLCMIPIALLPVIDAAADNTFSGFKMSNGSRIAAGFILAGGTVSLPLISIFYYHKHNITTGETVNLYNQKY